MPDELSPRRRALLDAAVVVTAGQGLRGLTHRAVDREAGLPQGSCSAYLRTRQALQTALAEYVAGILTHDVEALAAGIAHCDGVDQSAGLTTGMFLRWLEHPELLLTRLELTMESTRDAGLAEILTAGRARLVAIVAPVLAAKGHDRPQQRAEVMVASLDGVLLAALHKPARRRKAFLEGAMDLLMGVTNASSTP